MEPVLLLWSAGFAGDVVTATAAFGEEILDWEGARSFEAFALVNRGLGGSTADITNYHIL